MTQRNIVNIRSFFQSQSAAKKHAPQLEAYCTTPDDPLKLWVQYCFTTSQSFMVPSQPPAGHHEVFKSFIEFICSMYPAARIRQFAHCQIIKTNSIHFNNSWLLTCGQEGGGWVKDHAGNRSSVNGPPRATALSLPPVPLLQQQSSASCYQQLWWKFKGEKKKKYNNLKSSINNLNKDHVQPKPAQLYLIITAERKTCYVFLIILKLQWNRKENTIN